MLNVTTSWDDGDILDGRLSDMLLRYGITGTFYLSQKYRPQHVSTEEIRRIAKHHEIGAHTLTHPDLRTLSLEEKRTEIMGSKTWLEELLGTEVRMFCYPKGLYDTATIEATKEAGFLGARTTHLGSVVLHSDPFLMDTTLQVYPFPLRKLDAKKYYPGKLFEPFTQRAPLLRELGVPYSAMYSWLSVAKATFDRAHAHGEVFHLWGHSWEIEKYGMWTDLEKLLQYIANKKECVHVTNSALLQ